MSGKRYEEFSIGLQIYHISLSHNIDVKLTFYMYFSEEILSIIESSTPPMKTHQFDHAKTIEQDENIWKVEWSKFLESFFYVFFNLGMKFQKVVA